MKDGVQESEMGEQFDLGDLKKMGCVADEPRQQSVELTGHCT